MHEGRPKLCVRKLCPIYALYPKTNMLNVIRHRILCHTKTHKLTESKGKRIFICLCSRHEVLWRNGGASPCIPNLNTRRWVIGLRLRPFYPSFHNTPHESLPSNWNLRFSGALGSRLWTGDGKVAPKRRWLPIHAPWLHLHRSGSLKPGSLQYPLNRRLSGLQNFSRGFREDRNL